MIISSAAQTEHPHMAAMSTPLRLACVALMLTAATGCTNFMVTKGACEEGVNMISYTDDGGNNYGELRLQHPDPKPDPNRSPKPNPSPKP